MPKGQTFSGLKQCEGKEHSSTLSCLRWNYASLNSYKFYALGNRDSSVGIVTRWVRGSNPGVGKKIFFSPERPNRLHCPPSLILSGYQGLFTRLKRPEREVNLLTSSALVKNERRYFSAPTMCLHGVESEEFTFTFTVCVLNCTWTRMRDVNWRWTSLYRVWPYNLYVSKIQNCWPPLAYIYN